MHFSLVDLNTGLSKRVIKQLQQIQSTAVQILTKIRKVEHITQVLRSLHWLLVCEKVLFQIVLLDYTGVNSLGTESKSEM